MGLQSKKSFAMVNYEKCNPNQCDPGSGICSAVQACPQKIIKQLDGAFEPPMIFHELCLGCWECMESCPLKAVQIKEIS
ncbi:MAG TPA: 4Fe-4S binding protein [Desulfohalobiaceae bacterium]|nr:4Fe-4S binding protein [Desulfohalobiaceae bacterium]